MSLDSIAAAVKAHSGIQIDPGSACPQGGGSISQAWQLMSSSGPVFLKTNARANGADMLAAEVDGLEALAQTNALSVPTVLDQGATSRLAFLLLEWVDFSGDKSGAGARLGRRLARQHRHGGGDFGWHRDNTIGATPQPNRPCGDWVSFFRERRLGFQLQLAHQNGYRGRLETVGGELLDALSGLFDGHQPSPALLHGDLWGGNWGVTASGQPYVFDPAVYWGDREADIAMTRLFGGFGSAFYQAYQDEWPLPIGWEERAELYNLYHVLNHLNLFGGSYLAQAKALMEGLVKRSRG